MAERNVTFLIIAKDFASRVLKDVGDNTDRTAKKLRDLNTLGLGPLATAGAALGPALLPVLAGAAVGAVGLGTAFVGAGAAVGVFGAVTKSVFGEVLEASQKSEALRTKISLLTREIAVANAQGDSKDAATFAKQRTKALIEYRARLLELPPPMRAAVMGLDKMRSSWEHFVASNRNPVLAILATGMNTLAAVLPKLQPLFAVAAQYAGYLMNAIARFVTDGQLDRVVAFLTARAGPAFEHLGGALLSFGAGIGYLLAPWVKTSDGIVAGIDRISLSFVRWARGKGQAGMERILQFVRDQGPGAVSALRSLAGSVGTLAQAAAPLAPVSIAIASALGQIINALPQPILTALIGGFIAWNGALQVASASARGLLIVGQLVNIFRGLTAAVTGATLAENASTASKVAYSIATGIATVATAAWSAALWVADAALGVLLSPIFLIVAAVALFAFGVYEAWKHSETFRSVVTGAFHAVGAAVSWIGDQFSAGWGKVVGWYHAAEDGIGAVGRAVVSLGGWFSSAWDTVQGWYRNTLAFFQALPGRILGELVAFPGQYARLWKFTMERGAYYVGFAIGWTIRQMIELPGRISRALVSLGVTLGNLFSAAWGRVTSATSTGYHATLDFFRALPGQARRGLSTLGAYVWGQVVGAWHRATSATAAGYRSVVAWFVALPGRARSALSSLWSRISGAFTSAYANATAWAGRAVRSAEAMFRTLPGKAGRALAGIPGAVTGAFRGAGGWLLSAGGDIIRGLVRGIGNMAGAAVEEAKRIAGSIVSGVRNGLGIGSPSRVMADEVGRWIPPGIALGLTAATPGLLDEVTSTMDRVTQAARRPIVGQALLGADGFASTSPARTAAPMTQPASAPEVLQPIQLVVDGKVLQQVLLKIKRDKGGAALGLA